MFVANIKINLYTNPKYHDFQNGESSRNNPEIIIKFLEKNTKFCEFGDEKKFKERRFSIKLQIFTKLLEKIQYCNQKHFFLYCVYFSEIILLCWKDTYIFSLHIRHMFADFIVLVLRIL